MQLPDNFLPRATQILLPRLSTPDEREAWLAQAFFLNDPRLYHDLRQMTGLPIVYVTRCITALLLAKCVPGREVHSLALLLNAVRIGSAPSEQREIDDLVTMLDPMCGPDSAPEPADPIPDNGGTATRPAVPLQSIDTPVDQRTPTVFISYSHRDDEFAHTLITDLQNAGHAIWIDTVSIKGGDAWVRSIADGIRNSYAFLTVVTPDANQSRWVLREYLLAESLRKPIYPVLARQTDIPFQMIDRQLIDMHGDYADGLKDLLAVLPAPSIPVPPVDTLFPPPAPMPQVPASIPPPRPAKPTTAPRVIEDEVTRSAPQKKSSGLLDSLGDMLGELRDIVIGRSRDVTLDDEDRQSVPQPSEREETPPAEPQGEITPSAVDDDAQPETLMPSRRALELQFVQRQWAEVFSARQDEPSKQDGIPQVRWAALPDDVTGASTTGDMTTGTVKQAGAALMSLRRVVMSGATTYDVTEAVSAALDMLMQGTLNDPTQPLPVVIDLAKWTDADQSFDTFVQTQLGELGGAWHRLLEQRRVALLFTGFAVGSAAQRAAVTAFLRQYPDLITLVALQQE